MELAIHANSPCAVKDKLDAGIDATRLVEIQYEREGRIGLLSSFRPESVEYVSLLHIAVANCFAQGYQRTARSDEDSRQRRNSVDIVKLLLEHMATPNAAASFACFFEQESRWKCMHSASCIEFALKAKLSFGRGYLYGIDILDDIIEVMNDHCSKVVNKTTQVPIRTLELWQSLLLGNRFSDVRVYCDDGTVFHAHKAILASASSYFEARLFGPLSEGRDNQIEILHSRDAMQMLLTHIYTGSFDERMLDTHAVDLLNASNELLLTDFKELCEKHLAQTLCAANVKERMLMADKFQCLFLLKACVAFANQHSCKVFWNPGLRNLETGQPELWRKMELAVSGEHLDTSVVESGEQSWKWSGWWPHSHWSWQSWWQDTGDVDEM